MRTSNLSLLLALGALSGATLLAYWRAIDSPFIFDDPYSVASNPSILHLWPLLGSAEHPGPLAPPKDLPTSGRPLVNFSLAINYHFGRLDPVGYHVFNLIVHILSAFLLMAIVQRTLRCDYFGGTFLRASGPLAFVTALGWALHPLQTETVVYITQRTELMVGFFYLATLYASLRYWAAPSSASQRMWLVLATLACLAGMVCKEVMVTAPLAVLLFERTFITGSFRRALRQSWPLYAGLFLSWALLLYLNYNLPRADSAGFHLSVPAYAWWLTQTKVLLMYLKLAAWPWPLSIQYGMPYLQTLGAAWPWLVTVALLGIATLMLLWRRSAIGFVGAWVFLILSPTLIVPIVTEVAAERRMYLPLAALVTLVVVGGYRFVQLTANWLAADSATDERSSLRWPDAFAAAIALFLTMVLGCATFHRLAVYHDALTLWQDVLTSQPDNAWAHNNVGRALVEIGRVPEGIEQYQLALRINPELPEALNNLGVQLAGEGRLQEAVELYQHALLNQPRHVEALNNLAIVLAGEGRLQEAIELYQQALRIRPGYANAHNSLANALSDAGRLPEAIQQYQLALLFQPDFAVAHYNLGNALHRLGQLPDAIEHYQQAIQIDPKFTQAYLNLADVCLQAHRANEGVAAAELALGLARAQGNLDLVARIEAWLTAHSAGQSTKP